MAALLNSGKDKKPDKDLRQSGLYAAVPGLLLGGPLIGYLAGHWLDNRFGTDPLLAVVGMVMGLAAAGIEIYNLVKKATAIEKEKDRERHSGT